jgi:Domain of unknown function (DUF4184)
MPLTFAHPAAVIPLRRCGLPLSALIIGSIAPDLEYLLRLAPRSEISHTIHGLFLFCIPMGLLTLWILHRVWKEPVLALLAGGHENAQSYQPEPFLFLPFSRLVILGTTVLIGAFTHLWWDSFTHQDGWWVHQAAVLSTPIFETRWGTVPLYKLLQHGSTALGLAVIAIIAIRHKEWMSYISPTGWRRLGLICGTAVVVGFGIAILRTGPITDFRAFQRFVGIAVIASSLAVMAILTVVSLIWSGKRRRDNPCG